MKWQQPDKIFFKKCVHAFHQPTSLHHIAFYIFLNVTFKIRQGIISNVILLWENSFQHKNDCKQTVSFNISNVKTNNNYLTKAYVHGSQHRRKPRPKCMILSHMYRRKLYTCICENPDRGLRRQAGNWGHWCVYIYSFDVNYKYNFKKQISSERLS